LPMVYEIILVKCTTTLRYERKFAMEKSKANNPYLRRMNLGERVRQGGEQGRLMDRNATQTPQYR
jgi:hypothetical protein